MLGITPTRANRPLPALKSGSHRVHNSKACEVPERERERRCSKGPPGVKNEVDLFFAFEINRSQTRNEATVGAVWTRHRDNGLDVSASHGAEAWSDRGFDNRCRANIS